VNALAVVNNGASVVVAGHFSTLNGAAVHGIGEVSATTGANQTFAASNATLNGDDNSAFTALSVDNDTVYATGYSYGTGNLEGTLAINPNGGALRWVEDCHGDSYSIYATGTVEYLAGHPHTCGNIAGFPQIGGNDQTLWTYHRAIAFSKSVTGVIGTETGNFIGQPAPSLLTFFPDLEAGTYTGQYQGPWSVSGNGQYVVYGGEFPTVNGRTQQGLVRFAVPSVAPNKIGPADTEGLKPVLSSLSAGAVRISWQTASDKDNSDLTYSVYRSDKPDAPVYETTASSTFWARPTLSFLDQTAPAGKTVSYSVTARDPFGNSDTGAATSIAVSSAAGTALDDYAGAVVADGPVDYWRLGESSGNTLRDVVGNYDLTRSSGVTLGRPGALTGRTGTAAAFNGTATGIAATQTKVSAPRQFSMEAWFSTTSTSGGKLIGFGDSATGLSNGYDRQITMNTAGKLSFGVYNNTNTSVSSTAAYNDGKWHHVVATVSGTGMALFVDGAQVASKTVAGLVAYDGYWKLGGDRTWDGSNPYLNATVDDVAVYPAALTAAQVARHYTVGTTSPGTNKPPTAAFSSSVSGLTASLDGSGSTDADGTVAGYAWDFGDGQTGSGKTASHGYAAAGTYSVKLTVTDNAGTTGTVTKSVKV
jgi:PKD repeat protein